MLQMLQNNPCDLPHLIKDMKKIWGYQEQLCSQSDHGVSLALSFSIKVVVLRMLLVSVLHVGVMDQSSAVHKPACSLNVTQSMASDEWKFTASVHLP